MADAKKMNPLLKLALEVGPVAVYFYAYRRFADGVTYGGTEYSGVVAATAVFVPLILLSLVISWILTRTLPRMAVCARRWSTACSPSCWEPVCGCRGAAICAI